MDGRELAIRLKTISRRTPLVMVTPRDEPGIEDLDKSDLVDYFMEKPFNLNDMVTLVGSILGPLEQEIGEGNPLGR